MKGLELLSKADDLSPTHNKPNNYKEFLSYDNSNC